MLDFFSAKTSIDALRKDMEELEQILLSLEDCFDSMSTVGAIKKPLEKTYAPHKIQVLKWAWCEQVSGRGASR